MKRPRWIAVGAVLALICAGSSAVAASVIASNTGPDLERAEGRGISAGTAAGTTEGLQAGRADGMATGRDEEYKAAHRVAFKKWKAAEYRSSFAKARKTTIKRIRDAEAAADAAAAAAAAAAVAARAPTSDPYLAANQAECRRLDESQNGGGAIYEQCMDLYRRSLEPGGGDV